VKHEALPFAAGAPACARPLNVHSQGRCPESRGPLIFGTALGEPGPRTADRAQNRSYGVAPAFRAPLDRNSAPTHLSRSATRPSAATVTAGAVRCRLASDGRAHRARLSVARAQKHQGHGEVLFAVRTSAGRKKLEADVTTHGRLPRTPQMSGLICSEDETNLGLGERLCAQNKSKRASRSTRQTTATIPPPKIIKYDRICIMVLTAERARPEMR